MMYLLYRYLHYLVYIVIMPSSPAIWIVETLLPFEGGTCNDPILETMHDISIQSSSNNKPWQFAVGYLVDWVADCISEAVKKVCHGLSKFPQCHPSHPLTEFFSHAQPMHQKRQGRIRATLVRSIVDEEMLGKRGVPSDLHLS